MVDLFMDKGAVISDCEKFRYKLWRRWNPELPWQVWIMLNPSTADAETDDPTIKRLVKRATNTGFGGIMVFNLYCLRATDPSELWLADDPCGPEGIRYLYQIPTLSVLPEGGQIVCGWGEHAKKPRVAIFTDYLAMEMACKLHCLDTTKSGQPVHPLYQSYKKEPRLWMDRDTWPKGTAA